MARKIIALILNCTLSVIVVRAFPPPSLHYLLGNGSVQLNMLKICNLRPSSACQVYQRKVNLHRRLIFKDVWFHVVSF